MASFIGLHLERCSDADVLEVISDWLKPLGFGGAEPFQIVPASLNETRLRSADAVGCERLNDSWHLVLFNSHLLGGASIDEVTLAPVSKRVPARLVLVAAQTTSDVYQLLVYDKGELLRASIHAGGQLIQNSGPPLPGEPPLLTDMDETEASEDPPSPLSIARDVCAACGFDLWRTPPIQGPGRIWKRRSLLARWLRT